MLSGLEKEDRPDPSAAQAIYKSLWPEIATQSTFSPLQTFPWESPTGILQISPDTTLTSADIEKLLCDPNLQPFLGQSHQTKAADREQLTGIVRGYAMAEFNDTVVAKMDVSALVKKVTVFTKSRKSIFPPCEAVIFLKRLPHISAALSNGLHLVDVPGFGDISPLRERISHKAIMDAQYVFHFRQGSSPA